MNLLYTCQDMVEVVKVFAFVRQTPHCIISWLTYIHQVKDEYPFIKEYQNAWPVKMLMIQYLDNHRANLRTKAAARSTPTSPCRDTAGPSTTAAIPEDHGADHGGSQSGDPSNVSVSDIDKD